MKIDPTKIKDYSKEQLVKFHNEARDTLGVLEATRKEIGKELLSRMEGDGEVVGNNSLTKAKRVTFPEVTLDNARELGCTKEALSAPMLKKLLAKGVKIPHKTSEYLIVREIESENI